jgi:hypothetical protein
MSKLTIAMAALGAIARWVPMARSFPSANRVLEDVAAVHPSWPFVARARCACAASIAAIGSRAMLVASAGLLAAVLPALAYGSPPDPSWIQGIYDDADYDDAVVLAMSASGNVAPVAGPALLPNGPLIWALPELTETIAHDWSACSAQPRAPPAL